MNPLKKLKLLADRKTIIVEDPFIDSIMRAIPMFGRLAGNVEVELAAGVFASVPVNMHHEWIDRLIDIKSSAQSIAEQFGLVEDDVIRKILKHDGWVLTRNRIKTPAWMMSHVELEPSQLPVEIQWLGRFV